jgi:hypothetical protein
LAIKINYNICEAYIRKAYQPVTYIVNSIDQTSEDTITQCIEISLYTVKPVQGGHLCDNEKVML